MKKFFIGTAMSSICFGLPSYAGVNYDGLTIGSMYHFKIEQNDDGLADLPPVSKASPTLDSAFLFARLIAKADLSENTSIFVRYNFSKSELERYHLTHKLSDKISVLAGLEKARVFGWHRRMSNGLLATESRYISSSFRPFSNSIMLQLEAKHDLGKFTLQIVEDYANCGSGLSATCTSWNKTDDAGNVVRTQPGILTEWIGSFGSFQPLLQYARYDLSKSYTASAGLRYKDEGLDLHADYVIDERLLRGSSISGENQSTKVLNGLTFQINYRLDNLTPYAHYSSFNVKETSGSNVINDGVNTRYGNLNNGGQTIAFGAYYEGIGSYARPYVSVTRKSGDFKSTNDTTKTLSSVSFTVGLVGML